MPSQTSLFQVYLRLRPAIPGQTPNSERSEPWLFVEHPAETIPQQSPEDGAETTAAEHPSPIEPAASTHVTLQPPNDSRKRAVEKFVFTKVFEEESTQLDIFESTGTAQLVRNVIQDASDGLIATLGVTGSGKSHTILGSRSQRGLTQMTMDVLFRSIGSRIATADQSADSGLVASLQASEASEAQVLPARSFLESIYGVADRASSRTNASILAGRFSRVQRSMDLNSTPKRHLPIHPSALPLKPDVSEFAAEVDQSNDYAVLVSMYEVYNDRIFDLLSASMQPTTGVTATRQGAALQKDLRRRPLLFKPTEMSPDRKVVAGLRKIVCGTYEEAMMILEAGLAERRVAGTGSNTASSRSHGFFCIEVKHRSSLRQDGNYDHWLGGTLSIVDLAGSERARNAKTTGSTLAEAGKINESLMYLGQCLQVQSEHHDGSKPIVPFRQCKLTELLFSNSFAPGCHNNHNSYAGSRAPQKAVMIVTADPQGDFNATSQILRYSALAREVTVPRIPSVTSTLLAAPSQSAANNKHVDRPALHSDHHPNTNMAAVTEELEQAAAEIARLGEQCDQLTLRLAEEEIKRTEIELKLQATLQSVEERSVLHEQEIREECWAQMEVEVETEKQRWRQAREEERMRSEGLLDGKLDILLVENEAENLGGRRRQQQQQQQHRNDFRLFDEDAANNGEEDVDEREKMDLWRKIQDLERQLGLQNSPTKQKPSIMKEKKEKKAATTASSSSSSTRESKASSPTTPKPSSRTFSPYSSCMTPSSLPLKENIDPAENPFLSALKKCNTNGIRNSGISKIGSSNKKKNSQIHNQHRRCSSSSGGDGTGESQINIDNHDADAADDEDDDQQQDPSTSISPGNTTITSTKISTPALVPASMMKMETKTQTHNEPGHYQYPTPADLKIAGAGTGPGTGIGSGIGSGIGPGTAQKKVRKLTTRRWDFGDLDADDL